MNSNELVPKTVITCNYIFKYKHAHFCECIDAPYAKGGQNITETGTLLFKCSGDILPRQPQHWRQIVRSRLKDYLPIDQSRKFSCQLSVDNIKNIEEKPSLFSIGTENGNIVIEYPS